MTSGFSRSPVLASLQSTKIKEGLKHRLKSMRKKQLYALPSQIRTSWFVTENAQSLCKIVGYLLIGYKN